MNSLTELSLLIGANHAMAMLKVRKKKERKKKDKSKLHD